ncbi:unnamed protein product [Notodromas monacha]|uniref:Period circadian protein n=1 Tax=Notodromas monacha TaxID=399045 RepID=A0A7R9BMI3_9CRUS|nr:unnamed protein product [Notodromas monacha]CAG0918239.1 unnamed protein product [Notodromas monacha]
MIANAPVVEDSIPSSASSEDGCSLLVSLQTMCVVHASPTTKDTLGFSEQMLCSRSFLDYIYPRDRFTFTSEITSIMRALGEGKSSPESCTFYIRVRGFKSLDIAGFDVKTKRTVYKPFHGTMQIKVVKPEPEPGKDASMEEPEYYTLLKLVPIRSAYEEGKDPVGSFGTRHTSSCHLSHVDPAAIPYLGYLPQDLIGNSIFEYYHPEDLSYLKKDFESVLQRAGATCSGARSRFRAHNGCYLVLSTDWSCFVNPWTYRLEFVIGQHRVVETPSNSNVFLIPKETDALLSDEVLQETSTLQEEILALLSKSLRLDQKGTSAATDQNNFRKEITRVNNNVMPPAEEKKADNSGPDRCNSSSPQESVLTGHVSPLHEEQEGSRSNTSGSSTTTYNQLNYRESILRRDVLIVRTIFEQSQQKAGGTTEDPSRNNSVNRLKHVPFESNALSTDEEVNAMDSVSNIQVASRSFKAILPFSSTAAFTAAKVAANVAAVKAAFDENGGIALDDLEATLRKNAKLILKILRRKLGSKKNSNNESSSNNVSHVSSSNEIMEMGTSVSKNSLQRSMQKMNHSSDHSERHQPHHIPIVSPSSAAVVETLQKHTKMESKLFVKQHRPVRPKTARRMPSAVAPRAAVQIISAATAADLNWRHHRGLKRPHAEDHGSMGRFGQGNPKRPYHNVMDASTRRMEENFHPGNMSYYQTRNQVFEIPQVPTAYATPRVTLPIQQAMAAPLKLQPATLRIPQVYGVPANQAVVTLVPGLWGNQSDPSIAVHSPVQQTMAGQMNLRTLGVHSDALPSCMPHQSSLPDIPMEGSHTTSLKAEPGSGKESGAPSPLQFPKDSDDDPEELLRSREDKADGECPSCKQHQCGGMHSSSRIIRSPPAPRCRLLSDSVALPGSSSFRNEDMMMPPSALNYKSPTHKRNVRLMSRNNNDAPANSLARSKEIMPDSNEDTYSFSLSDGSSVESKYLSSGSSSGSVMKRKRTNLPPWMEGVEFDESTAFQYTMPVETMNDVLRHDREALDSMQQGRRRRPLFEPLGAATLVASGRREASRGGVLRSTNTMTALGATAPSVITALTTCRVGVIIGELCRQREANSGFAGMKLLCVRYKFVNGIMYDPTKSGYPGPPGYPPQGGFPPPQGGFPLPQGGFAPPQPGFAPSAYGQQAPYPQQMPYPQQSPYPQQAPYSQAFGVPPVAFPVVQAQDVSRGPTYMAGGSANQDTEPGPAAFGSSFGEKAVRRAFVRKVYGILSVQLLTTLAFIAVTFLGTYIALMCCPGVRRKYPTNMIVLAVFTLAMSFMTGAISSVHNTQIVLMAVAITAGVTILVTVVAITTKFDVTGCGMFLFVASMVVLVFGLITMVVFFVDRDSHRVMSVVYGGLIALLFCMYLMYDVQQIMGGRRIELSPEEHVYGAITLYVDIVASEIMADPGKIGYPGPPPAQAQYPAYPPSYSQQQQQYGQQTPYPSSYNPQQAPYAQQAQNYPKVDFQGPQIQDATRGPVYQPGEQRDLEAMPEGYGLSFGNQAVRRAFVRKVYSILSLQLLTTSAFIAMFVFNVVFFATYLSLVCVPSLRRNHPANLIVLGIFRFSQVLVRSERMGLHCVVTLAMSFMIGAISAFHNVADVFLAVGMTAGVVVLLTLLATTTKVDVTGMGMYLFVAGLVVLVFGVATMIVYYVDQDAHRIMSVVYGGLTALLFSMYLVFDVQQIMGGRKIELSPEEHIYAAITLYLDIIYIFLGLLQIISRTKVSMKGQSITRAFLSAVMPAMKYLFLRVLYTHSQSCHE